MGEQGALKGDGKPHLVAEQSSGDKLAEFGRSLFKKGKSLAEDVQDKVGDMDLKGLASKAEKQLQGVDTRALAEQAGKALKNVDAEKLAGAASLAGGMAFPQLAILERGSGELGDLIARKQARSLLDDPKRLSDKLVSSFDEFDRDKSGFLDDGKLRKFDGITGIAGDNRAAALIMRSGFSTFNSLDGDASKKGISRRDVQTFALMQNKDLLNDYVAKTANEHGIAWGLAGAGAAASLTLAKQSGFELSMQALKSASPGKLALAATVGALAVGGIADLWSRHSQHKFYEEKGRELNQLFGSMKNSF